MSEASSAFQDHSGLRDDVCLGSEFGGRTYGGLALLRIQPPIFGFLFAFDYTPYYSVHNRHYFLASYIAYTIDNRLWQRGQRLMSTYIGQIIPH